MKDDPSAFWSTHCLVVVTSIIPESESVAPLPVNSVGMPVHIPPPYLDRLWITLVGTRPVRRGEGWSGPVATGSALEDIYLCKFAPETRRRTKLASSQLPLRICPNRCKSAPRRGSGFPPGSRRKIRRYSIEDLRRNRIKYGLNHRDGDAVAD